MAGLQGTPRREAERDSYYQTPLGSPSSVWRFTGCPQTLRPLGPPTAGVGALVCRVLLTPGGGATATAVFTGPGTCNFTAPGASGLRCSIKSLDGLPVELMEFSVESTADADAGDTAAEEAEPEPEAHG